jgi:hypothetical protein
LKAVFDAREVETVIEGLFHVRGAPALPFGSVPLWLNFHARVSRMARIYGWFIGLRFGEDFESFGANSKRKAQSRGQDR